jgi:hypothetical protein
MQICTGVGKEKERVCVSVKYVELRKGHPYLSGIFVRGTMATNMTMQTDSTCG